MAKQRFRKVKHTKPSKETSATSHTLYAPAGLKIKAFLTDAFMLLMPILYIVFYGLMDGREDFAAHKLLGWFSILIALVVVQTAFMIIKGQTPGYRAYSLRLIAEKTQTTPSLPVVFLRNTLAVFSFFSVIGWMLMFFRKDRKTLHDLISATAVIHTP